MNDAQLREYFNSLGKRRGIESFFDRFEQDSTVSNGLKLHLDVIAINRNKPTLVFVPGTSVYAMMFGEFQLKISQLGFNTVGLDPRGHGRSEGARGSYTIPELITDTQAAVEYARERFGDPIAIAGSSQGGVVAFYYAATGNPIAGVVCHNIADLGDPATVQLTRYPRFSRVLKPMIKIFASIFPEIKIPIGLYLDLKEEEAKGFENAKEFVENDPLAVPLISLKSMASLASEKLAQPVEQITTPVQILHGGRDNIFPQAYIEYIYNRLMCKKALKVYPDLPHLIMTDYVDSILPDVVEWLEGVCS